jgi:hypothetical protein
VRFDPRDFIKDLEGNSIYIIPQLFICNSHYFDSKLIEFEGSAKVVFYLIPIEVDASVKFYDQSEFVAIEDS